MSTSLYSRLTTYWLRCTLWRADCDSIGDDAFFRYVNRSLPPADRPNATHQVGGSHGPVTMALGPHAVRTGLIGGCDTNCGGTYAQFMFDAVGDPAPHSAPHWKAARQALTDSVERLMTQAISTGFLEPNSSTPVSLCVCAARAEPELCDA